LEIFNGTMKQMDKRGGPTLKYLAWLPFDNKQLDTAEGAASRVLNLV
jgi:hypothetical protein